MVPSSMAMPEPKTAAVTIARPVFEESSTAVTRAVSHSGRTVTVDGARRYGPVHERDAGVRARSTTAERDLPGGRPGATSASADRPVGPGALGPSRDVR